MCPFWICRLSGVGQAMWPDHGPQTGSSGPYVRTRRDAELDSDGEQWLPLTTHTVTSQLPDHWLGHPSMRAAKKKWWNLVLLAFVICQINVSYGDHPLSWRILSLTSGQEYSNDFLWRLPTPALTTFLLLSGLILTYKRSLWGRHGVSSSFGSVTQYTDKAIGNPSPVASISLLLCQSHYIL